MYFQYQMYDNDCLLASIYSLLVNFYKIKFSYSSFLINFKIFNQNLYNFENNLKILGIKITIFQFDKISMQSLNLNNQIIYLQNINNTYHSAILFNIIRNKYYIFCPIEGKKIISTKRFLDISSGIFIKVNSFDIDIYNKNKLKTNIKNKSKKLIFSFINKNIIWKTLLVSIFLLTRNIITNFDNFFNIYYLIFELIALFFIYSIFIFKIL